MSGPYAGTPYQEGKEKSYASATVVVFGTNVGLAGHLFCRILSNALSYKLLLRCLRHVCMPVALLELYLQGAGLLGPSGCAHSSSAHGGVLVNLHVKP